MRAPRRTLNRRAAPAQAPGGYPAIPWVLAALFLAFIVFRYLEGGQRIEALGQIRFELLLGAALSVVGVALFMKETQRPPTPALRWAIALAGWMLVMVLLSEDVAFSWGIFIDRLAKFMMVAIFIGAFVVNPVILRWFIAAYLFAFAKMAQEGIHGLVSGSLVWENQGVMRLHGPTWSYAHPNSFSGTQLGTLPFLYEFAPLAPKLLRILMALQAVAALTIILYCGSRTAYLGFFVWLALLVVRARSSFKAFMVLLALVAVSAPLIPDQYIARLETIFTQQEIEGASIDARKEILADAVTIFIEHPVGVGVGAFPIVRQERFGRSQDTHNLYLEVATNLGVVGVVLFLGMVVSMLRLLLRLSRQFKEQLETIAPLLPPADAPGAKHRAAARHAADLRVMHAAAQATFAFLIIRLTLGAFGHDLYEVYWWFALGIAIALNQMQACAARITQEMTANHRGEAPHENGRPAKYSSPAGRQISLQSGKSADSA